MLDEILAERPLAAIAAGRKAHPRIKPPQGEGDVLAEMADRDPQVGIVVEQAGAAQAQRVDRGFDRETPGRGHQPAMALVVARRGGNLHPGMEIEGHVEFRDGGPEAAVFGDVVVDRAVRLVLLGEAVDHRALEAEVAHAAGEFRRGRIGVLHRQRREAGIAVRKFRRRLGDPVVGLAGDRDRFIGIEDALDRRRVERQQRELDAAALHRLDALLADIQQFPGEFVPAPGFSGEMPRPAEGFLDRHMLFERDLSLHSCLP